ncbi:MAG TPA: hypothetical protein DF282_07690 [Hyphomonas sp.]|nr:hypothetical protein [Hyphomonas sp.]
MICLLVMSVLMLFNVGTRYLDLPSVMWSDEAIQFLTIWMVSFGTVAVAVKKEHIAVELFQEIAGHHLLRFLSRSVAILTFLAAGGIGVSGFWLAWEAFSQMSPVLRFPRSYWYLALAFLGFATAFVMVFHFAAARKAVEQHETK